VGGAAVVVDVGSASGAGRVEGSTWGAAEVVGTAQGVAEVGEAGDKEAALGLVVRPPRVAV
jgi:hypothetical protein